MILKRMHFQRSPKKGGFAGLALALAGKAPSDVPLVKGRLERCRTMIEQRLGEAPFFGGRNPSLADIMMVWSLTTARTFRVSSCNRSSRSSCSRSIPTSVLIPGFLSPKNWTRRRWGNKS